MARLDVRTTDVFCDKLRDLEARSQEGKESVKALFDELKISIREIFDACLDVERTTNGDKDFLREKQREFREKTHGLFQKSNLMNHARTWPQGHPGDYKIIEKVYRNTPLSEGIGYLLDLYFLSSTLAVAVRERIAMMREILARELEARANPSVLNVACGSAREIFELAPDIEQSGANVTCVDFDSDALNFAQGRLSVAGVQARVSLRKYNALRMVSPERNVKEFGLKDVIYSIGLFDYLTDDVLIKLIGALYDLLNPGGKLIAVFKDSNRYETMDYHWLVDWSAFYQRTEHESRAILEKAGIPEGAVTTERTLSGVIIFYTVTKG